MNFETSLNFRPVYRFSLAFAIFGAMLQSAHASTIVGSFTLNGGGLVKGAAGPSLCWDLQPSAGGIVVHDCFNINTNNGTGANGATTDNDIAGQLAANINNKLPGAATASGAEVQISGYTASQPLKTNQYSYTTDEFYFAAGLGASINFNPDLDTGTPFLTSQSSFDFTGPNGLDATFTAANGTTDDTLAQLFGSLMDADGYSATVTGDQVSFQTLDAGSFSFSGSGDGVDVAFGVSNAPEPGTDLLAGSVLLAIGLVSRRRSRAVAK
jgi:hypothetical protein